MVCYVKLYQRITLVERVNKKHEEDPEMKDRKKTQDSSISKYFYKFLNKFLYECVGHMHRNVVTGMRGVSTHVYVSM